MTIFDLCSVSSGSFSIGFNAYMWYWQKSCYDNFKEEILNYDHIDKKLFETEVMVKVKKYIQTNMAKSMKSNFLATPPNAPITIDHLIAITLYTDYTELSSDFSASFRRKNPFESEESVKQRNHSKYWWWSTTLKQVLDGYGQSKYLEGPFYCGMSWVMTLPQFQIHLYSPTSTSVQIAVALKFCGDSGIVMEFTNTEGKATGTKGFDCSWLSRFKEEDERYYIFPNQI